MSTPEGEGIHARKAALAHPSLIGHLEILRVDHWFKNVFVLPGIIAAIGMDPGTVAPHLGSQVALGLITVCIIASSNYIINEVTDARYDRYHPTKNARPVPSGRVHIPLAYLQWLALCALGVLLALRVSRTFALTMLVLWMMGCIYNIPPIRTKDVPYLDVLTEGVNNPLRLLAGWFMVSTASFAPASLLLSYWMVGCYFMSLKRFAEYRNIGDPVRVAAYRKSLAILSERRLLVSTMFYGSSAMLFFGAFIMRYRLELIASFPLVALVMAVYLSLAFNPDSAVQSPEKLYREPALMGSVIACALLMTILLFVDVPMFHRIFSPTAPVARP